MYDKVIHKHRMLVLKSLVEKLTPEEETDLDWTNSALFYRKCYEASIPITTPYKIDTSTQIKEPLVLKLTILENS